MLVRLTLSLGDLERRALAARVGEEGLASRATVLSWASGELSNSLDTIVSELSEGEVIALLGEED